MYKEDTSFTIKTGVENMSPKEVVNLLRQTVWAKDRKKEAIIKSLNHSICYGAFTCLLYTSDAADDSVSV